jgi:hypothetical protein
MWISQLRDPGQHAGCSPGPGPCPGGGTVCRSGSLARVGDFDPPGIGQRCAFGFRRLLAPSIEVAAFGQPAGDLAVEVAEHRRGTPRDSGWLCCSVNRWSAKPIISTRYRPAARLPCSCSTKASRIVRSSTSRVSPSVGKKIVASPRDVGPHCVARTDRHPLPARWRSSRTTHQCRPARHRSQERRSRPHHRSAAPLVPTGCCRGRRHRHGWPRRSAARPTSAPDDLIASEPSHLLERHHRATCARAERAVGLQRMSGRCEAPLRVLHGRALGAPPPASAESRSRPSAGAAPSSPDYRTSAAVAAASRSQHQQDRATWDRGP